MKTLFTICLFAIGTQLTFAQQDTLNLNFRDKEVQVLSDENGIGSKTLTFDDGARKTRVLVDFNAENTGIAKPTSVENYYVKKQPSFETKKNRKIYYTFDVKLGISDLILFNPQYSNPTNGVSWGSQRHQNNVIESKNHAINFGIEIPSKWQNIYFQTGLGISSRKLAFDNNRFRISTFGPGYYYSNPNEPSTIDYDDYIYNVYINSLTIPLVTNFKLGKKGWSSSIGIENNINFNARQSQGKNKEYSFLGMVYKGRASNFGSSNVQSNFTRYSVDGILSLNKGILGVYAGVNITSMFNDKFYSKEEPSFSHTLVREPFLLRYGLQLNIW